MQTVLLVVHLMVVLTLVAVVLLQRSEGGALGIGGGGGGGFFSSRGTANLLTRTTAILAGIFFVTSLALTLLANFDGRPSSILDGPGAPAGTAGAPGDTRGSGEGILDILRGAGPGEPAAPTDAAPAPAPAPTGPQVPTTD